MSAIAIELLGIEKIVHGIEQLHNEFSKKWLESNEHTYNLKTVQIRDIFKITSDYSDINTELDYEFVTYMNQYCEKLNEIYFHPYYEFLDCDLPFNSRIKDPSSRISKILHYMHGKDEQGSVNIKKCLNDLLGFRVWVDDFEHTDEMLELVKSRLANSGVKVHNSSKGEYKATHIYFFNGNNKFFPWELQIWRNKDHETNIISHSEHKQGYTKWPMIYVGE